MVRYDGCALHLRLYNFIFDCWSAKCILQHLKNANIIPVYKQKGDQAECGNSSGISLLSLAGNVLEQVLLEDVDLILPESQCSFVHGHSPIYVIFIAWQLQEECREQYQDL